MKRIYYYFEFKKLLKRYELTSFIYFVLKYKRKSFFKLIRGNPKWWFNNLIVSKDILDYLANCYSSIDQKSIIKRYNQAKDYWMKFIRL